MSTTASVMDLFDEYQEGGGASPYHEPGDYTLEASSYYVHQGASLSLTTKIVEGPATGQALGLGFIMNVKSPESFKRSLLIARLFGIGDEYLKAITEILNASGGLAGDTESWMNAIGNALMGRVFKIAVAKDEYQEQQGKQANKMPSKAKPQLIAAPALPGVAGAPVPAQAAAPVAAPVAPVAAPVAEAVAPAAAPVAAPVAAVAVAPAVVPAPAEVAQPQAVPVVAQPAAVAPVPVAEAAPVVAPVVPAPATIPVADEPNF